MKNTVAFSSRRPRLLGEFRQILSVSGNVKEGCREFTALIYKDLSDLALEREKDSLKMWSFFFLPCFSILLHARALP